MNERQKQPQVACALVSGLVLTGLAILATLYVWGLMFLKANEPLPPRAAALIAVVVGALSPFFASGFLHLLPPMSCPDCTQPLPRKRFSLRDMNLTHWSVCRRCGCEVDVLGRKSS
jgi:hypothetical protein